MKKIILASNSPRRRELLSGLDMEFEVRVIMGIDESYPPELPVSDIAGYIASKKASAYALSSDEVLVTADTIVVLGSEVMEKPKDREDACRMLRELSGKTHQVITGCCIRTTEKEKHFSVFTNVTFRTLKESEIEYYVDTYKPFDKAGAYGIQEWIGYVGVSSIEGSYFNVMGLPVQCLYEALQSI